MRERYGLWNWASNGSTIPGFLTSHDSLGESLPCMNIYKYIYIYINTYIYICVNIYIYMEVF